MNFPLDPGPIWLSAATSALLAPFALKVHGLPHPVALAGLSGIYTGIGFLLEKDPFTGSSIASAWGIIHIIGTAKNAIASKRILPMSHLIQISLVTGIYLREFIKDF
jgi:hypothetical protein